VPEGAILPNVSSFDLTSVKPSGLCHFMQTNESFYSQFNETLQFFNSKGIQIKSKDELRFVLEFINAKNMQNIADSLDIIVNQTINIYMELENIKERL
jgi:hypothetical protein